MKKMGCFSSCSFTNASIAQEGGPACGLAVCTHNPQVAKYDPQVTKYKTQVAKYDSQVTQYKAQVAKYDPQVAKYKAQVTQYTAQAVQDGPRAGAAGVSNITREGDR
jgi:hypothetical protein